MPPLFSYLPAGSSLLASWRFLYRSGDTGFHLAQPYLCFLIVRVNDENLPEAVQFLLRIIEGIAKEHPPGFELRVHPHQIQQERAGFHNMPGDEELHRLAKNITRIPGHASDLLIGSILAFS